MSKVSYLLTDKSVTFVDKDGHPHQVSRDSVTFGDVIAELAKVDPNEARLIDLAKPIVKIEREIRNAFDAAPVTQNYLAKRTVEVTRNGVLLDGQPMAGVLVDRMLEMVALGLPLGGMIRFMENLYMNPASFARDELYLWLEGTGLSITDDGHFLAYKYVNEQFRDCYSGKFDNSPGQIVQLAGRHVVDPDRNNTCSTGLHFCSASYLGYAGGPRFVLLKINPADVVSIPADYDNAKGRAWRYEVLREVVREEIDNGRYESAPLVANDGSDYSEFDEDGVLKYTLDGEGQSVDVTIETDEDGDFYVYVTNGDNDAESYNIGTLAEAKALAVEMAGDLEIEPNEEDDEVEYSESNFTTVEGSRAYVSGPDDDGEYFWTVGHVEGYADSEEEARRAVERVSAAEASPAPLIREADPELEALLAEEEEIQRQRDTPWWA